ncbi:MAG: hypothetical protein O3B05_00585 [archaeon]|nr:hypothetical protein [archaeon]
MPEHHRVFIVQERYLAACLEAGFAKPMLARQRLAVVSREDEFKLLEKPWQGILLLALNEIAPPTADDDEDGSAPMRGARQMRGRRGGRNARSSSSPLDNLPTAEVVAENDAFSPAFAFAVLTARKGMESDAWDNGMDAHLDRLRDRCLAEGVHPVWHAVARRSPLLSLLGGFPEGEDAAATVDLSTFDASLGDISGSDATELLRLLTAAAPYVLDASQKVALATVTAQVESGRGLTLDAALEDLEGPLSVVPVVVAQACNQPLPIRALEHLKAHDEPLASAHEDLAGLKQGKVTSWSTSAAAGDASSLAHARSVLAWRHAPEAAAEATSNTLQHGLDLLTAVDGGGHDVERLRWWHLGALVREGEADQASSALQDVSVDPDADVDAILSLVLAIGTPEAIGWFENLLNVLHADGLRAVVQHAGLPSEVRMQALRRMQDATEGGLDVGHEDIIPLLLDGMELRRLARVLSDDDVANAHPWEVVLCAHLLAANRDMNLYHSIRAQRARLVSTLHDASPPTSFSDVTPDLLRLLEGGQVASDLFTMSKSALKAFGQITKALAEEGNGRVDDKAITAFEKEAAQLDLTAMDAGLVRTLLTTLRLNVAIHALQNGTAGEETTSTVNALVAEANVPTRVVHAVRNLLFDHDLPLPALAAWYQEHDPTSPWSIVSRATVASAEGQHLRAAQEYGRAAKAGQEREVSEDNEFAFDFEHRVALNRKSLIHFAFAGEWKRAIDLLEDEASLRTAMTERFQLYLRVSYLASQGRTDDATQLIQQAVLEREVIFDEDDEGNVIERRRTWFNEDVLDLLMAYPRGHAIPLPDEPFTGRVRAAQNLTAQRSRHRRNADQRYAQLMDASPTPEEVYELASRVAEDQALTGLMYLERALGANCFRLTQQRQLQRSMHSLFTMKRGDIPVRDRRHLRHLPLPPLVLVDTNVLVDALLDRLIRETGRNLGAGLAIDASRDMHHHLERLGREGKIRLFIPDVVKHELSSIAKGGDVLRHRLHEMVASPDDVLHLMEGDMVQEAEAAVMKAFDTWADNEPRFEEEARADGRREQLEAFLIDHKDIYDEVSAMKRMRGSPKRTMLDGMDIYPESEDLDIMCLAMHLASMPLQDLGAVLVATRDGDFSLVAPSLIEHLGFGAVRSARQLNEWIRA